MSAFIELAETMKAFQEEMMAKGQVLLQDYFKEFFDAFPEVTALTWTQYTPYFNDGDECTFGVGEVNFAFGPILEEDDSIPSYPEDNDEGGWHTTLGFKYDKNEEQGFGRYDKDTLTGRDKELYDAMTGMERAFGVNEDVLKSVFGDHVLVYVDRKGSRTDEYYHD